ncbi:MAG: hypothetical protein ACYDG2_00240 [Ruminiclostridium sp.]
MLRLQVATLNKKMEAIIMKLTSNLRKIGVATLVVTMLATTSIVASAATNNGNADAKSALTSATMTDGEKLNKHPDAEMATFSKDEKTREITMSIEGGKTWTPYESALTFASTADGEKLNKQPDTEMATFSKNGKTGEITMSTDGGKTWAPYENTK